MPDEFPKKRLIYADMVLLFKKVVIGAKLFSGVLEICANISAFGGQKRMIGRISRESDAKRAFDSETGAIAEYRVPFRSQIQIVNFRILPHVVSGHYAVLADGVPGTQLDPIGVLCKILIGPFPVIEVDPDCQRSSES